MKTEEVNFEMCGFIERTDCISIVLLGYFYKINNTDMNKTVFMGISRQE